MPKGVYVRTAEARANIAAAARGKVSSVETVEKRAAALRGRTYSVEHRARISAGRTGMKVSAETCKKISAALLGSKRGPYASRPPRNVGYKASPETREKQRAAKLLNPTRYWLGKGASGHSGHVQTPEARARIRDSNRLSFQTRDHGKRGKHVFAYAGVAFRSSYEVRMARAWDELNIEWIYEPRIFRLSTGALYQPDFYHPSTDSWTEVKGYCTESAQRKIDLFTKEISARIAVVRRTDIELIEHQIELRVAQRRKAKGA